MAPKRSSAGLTIGQLLTLTVGFLAASVVIFFFGLWVGRDLATQKLGRDTEIIRIPVMSPTSEPTSAIQVVATPTVRFARVVPPTRTAIRFVATPSATATAASQATAAPRKTEPAPAATLTGEPAVEIWRVQASATRDGVQAAVLKRSLRSKGYDAYITEATIAGVTWYRVQVGKYSDRASAKSIEARLRRDEGLEAAFATRQ